MSQPPTQEPTGLTSPEPNECRAYLVGGGIASLSAAAFLIRDGDFPGHRITIIEELDRLGGSMDGSGSADAGYVLRGGRMFESKYVCTFDLFSSIPVLDGSRSVTAETLAWNETMKTSSKSRLVRNGRPETAPAFGLQERHILTIEKLVLEPEAWLGASRIEDHFDVDFFRTNFWFMWSTTFAFQRWHSATEFKRYLVRFAHMVRGFDRLEGILRTVYNQYDSMVRPLKKWLDDRGVVFEYSTTVTDLRVSEQGGTSSVVALLYRRGDESGEIAVASDDIVLVTLGSMTEASSLGTMDSAPEALDKRHGGAWTLWETLAKGRPGFGNPAAFDGHIPESTWVSFTTTLHKPDFIERVRDLTGNVAGEGGLITFPDSAWMASIVIPHQPHFIGQPDDTGVFWGYGLAMTAPGDFVGKSMPDCTGREIMTEILGHLGFASGNQTLLDYSNCIPCRMPFITSQFLPRSAGDRPPIIPEGTKNLAFIGQFCEQPDDVVFTVEYSIRSAQTAVYELLSINRKPPPVYKGKFDPRVVFEAFMALHDLPA